MADPLSISASIAGVVTLADVVFLRLTKYIKSVKNAEKEIKDLCTEVNLLGGAVSMLSRLARGYEMDDEAFDKDFRMYHIEACASILNQIYEKTKKYDANPKSKVLKLMWPYTSSKTKELLADLSRHKENINLALSANSMELIGRYLMKEEDRAKTTAEIQAEVKKTREIVDRIQLNSQRKKVLEFFLLYNPQPNYEICIKLRHSRTGKWLENHSSFKNWLSTPGSRLWLNGIPGGGKTILAGYIIGRALARTSKTVATAFFFCDYKNEMTRKAVGVLGAVAHQLARQNPQAYMMLENYYCELHPERRLPRSPDPDELIIVIVKMAQVFNQVHLVVDGLDECHEGTEEVGRALCLIAASSDEISIAVSSRPEGIIQRLLDQESRFVTIQIEAYPEDITHFVTSEVQRRIWERKLQFDDPSLEAEIMHGLVDGANGMFRWVACQLDNLAHCMSDDQYREALRSLPPDLPETYLRDLRRIPEAQRSYVQLTLNFIAYAEPKLTIEQLREILSVPSNGSLLKASGRIREDAVTEHCSSLVRKANDGKYLEFAHSSVQEFLSSDILETSDVRMFAISKRRCNRILATKCLEYLQLENFNHTPAPTEDQLREMRRTKSDRPLYRYASGNWFHHAREEWDDPELLACAKRLFSPCKTSCFSYWAVDLMLELRGWTSPLDLNEEINLMAEIVHGSFRPLHLAATLGLPEISSFLLTQFGHLNEEAVITRGFECAVDCLYGSLRFLHSESLTMGIPHYLRRYIGTASPKSQFTLQTIRIFLRHINTVPNDLISLAMSCWLRTRNFSVIQLLIAEGTELHQTNLDQFSRVMERFMERHPSCWDAEQIRSLFSFCECLSHMADESALHFELCQLAWELSLKLGDEKENIQAYDIDSRISESPSSLKISAISACRNIEACALQRLTNDPRLDISSVIDSTNGNGLLHMMVLADHTSVVQTLGISKYTSEINKLVDILLAGGCSLSSTNYEGFTPLSLALEQQQEELSIILLKRPEVEQNDCKSPVPILLFVAELGCGAILDQLLRLDLKISPGDYSVKSPLHCLQYNADLVFTTRLEELLPGSRQLRLSGQMPWELYLNATHFDPPHSDVLEYLVQPLLSHSYSLECSKIWECYVTNLSLDSLQPRHRLSDRIINNFVQTGVLKHYETSHSISGVFIFSSLFEDYLSSLEPPELPITDSTMCLLIESTEHWTTFQDSTTAVNALKLSINRNYEMTSACLLRRGVGIHRRHHGISTLEHVFALPAINDNSVSRIQKLLQYADPTLLNQTNPSSGLGLVHSSNSQDKAHLRCRILEVLVDSGANPNLRTTDTSNLPALVYHLHRRNDDMACVLFGRGASALTPSLDGWTAVHMAAWRDAASFLSNLVSQNGSMRTQDWEMGCRHSNDFEHFSGVTPLHLAAAGSVDTLGIILDKVPEINLETRTDEGLTPLHFAAIWGCVNGFEVLVSRGANINARSTNGHLPLHFAAKTGNLALVERLLELNNASTAGSDGVTPLHSAYQSNRQVVIDRLETHASGGPIAAAVSASVQFSALAKAVSSAVRDCNLNACQSLLRGQPSVDIDVSENGLTGLTPLAIAIRLGMLTIVRWLLERGANANCQYESGSSALRDTFQNATLNPILETMLQSYLAGGGSILGEPGSLAYLAVDANNTEGLSMLLCHLRDNTQHYGEQAGISGLTALRLAVNRKHNGSTALHRAIETNNKAAIRLLIENEANLEARDSLHRTPLLLAAEDAANIDASSIVSMLVKAGSNIDCRDGEGAWPLSRACASLNLDLILYLMELGVDVNAIDQRGLNALHYLVLRTDAAKTNSLLPSIFLRLTRIGIDPYNTDRFGWSSLHLSTHRTSMTSFLLNGELQNFELAPMPWSTTPQCPAFPEVACITSGFRLYRRKMSFESFRKLLNTEPVDAWSPLCRAAAIGNTEAMKNLLLMGSQIDFEGCPDGSALMAASRAGNMESVIFLTRHGASISFLGSKQRWSAAEASANSPKILHWLLVDRFTDQFKLREAPVESDAPAEHFRKWSGTMKAEMIMLGQWERRPSESSRQYWSRLEQMKQDFHGKVVPPDQGANTRRQSKLVPSESVRIAAGGYNSTKGDC